MAGGQLRTVISQLRRQSGSRLSDAELLDNFITRRDEASFEVLVWRYGTMILNLCQRVLHDSHAAEDAFQATFLVFARKAGSIGRREAVGSWLYKVAYRVALRVRARAARRSAREEPAGDLPARDDGDDVLWRDLRPVLDEEIDRLPEKYRTPFVLCYLQGHTNEEAAEQIGCPKGTVLSRLARGRERLRSRLVRRGVALSAAGLSLALSQSAPAAVPPALVSSTVEAAVPFAAGQAAAGLVSASVAALTEGVLHTMFLTKLKVLTAALLALAVLVGGAGTLTHTALARVPKASGPEPAAESAAQEGAGRGAREGAAGQVVRGQVVAVAKGGKGITVEIPAQARGEEPKRINIAFGDKTAVTYNGVGPNGAKPTEGYFAQVRLQDGAKDVAAEVTFSGKVGLRRQPDLIGKVAGISKDGKSITVEEVPARPARGQEPKKIDLKFNDKTLLAFSGVAKGEAKLTEGYGAQVWLVDRSKDTAGQVLFFGPEQLLQRGDKGPDVMGKVVAVVEGGKTITLEIPPKTRGEEPAKLDVKLSDTTPVVYQDVLAGQAKLAEGLRAAVWLQPGSKDAAAKVGLHGRLPERWTTVTGKVAAVSKDGNTVTLEQPAQARGEEPKRVDVKLTIDTQISYSGVGPGEAKLTEGYMAQARLLDGSTDTAAQLSLSKPGAERRR